MRAYVEFDRHGFPKDANCYSAWDGFQKLGYKVTGFQYPDLVSTKIGDYALDTDIFVGDVRSVRARFKQISVEPPSMIVPEYLEPFLGRSQEIKSLGDIRYWGIKSDGKESRFIKPIQHKLFNGRVVNKLVDIADLGNLSDDTAVILQDVVEFISEWRVYVMHGGVLKICNYAGDPTLFPHMEQVYQIINVMLDCGFQEPQAYGIDVGWTSHNMPVLVELNDGWALGNYGLDSVDYATFLKTRWMEMVGCTTEG